MNFANIRDSTVWFQILQTSRHSQTAVMTLQPGGSSSKNPNTHEKSDQILLVVDGEIEAQINDLKQVMHAGDVCLVPAGTKHNFKNNGRKPVLTFNVYSPPEYSTGTNLN